MAIDHLKNVVIIEADASIQVLLKSYFGNIGGVDTRVCRTPDEARSFLIENPPVDLLILDWKFKDPLGPKLLDDFKSQDGNARIPVLLISGMITKSDIDTIKSFERTNFLIKPFTEEVFLSILAKSFPQLSADKNKKKAKPAQKAQEISKVGDRGLYLQKGAPQPRTELDIQKRTHRLRAPDTKFNWRSKMTPAAFEAMAAKKGWGSRTINKAKDSAWSSGRNTDADSQGWGIKQAGKGQLHDAGKLTMAAGGSGSVDAANTKNKIGSAAGADQTDNLPPNAWDLKVAGKKPTPLNASTQSPIPNKTTFFKDARTGKAGPAWQSGLEPANQSQENDLTLDPNDAPSEPSGTISPKNAPLSAESDTGTNGAAKESQTSSFENALVVERDPSLQTLLVRYLGAIGVKKTTPTDSGKKAWEAIEQGAYDFVVMDWVPAETSGLALYSRIRRSEVGKHLPMIVTSGVVGRKDFRLLEENPSTKLVEKPFQLATLKKAIDELKTRRFEHLRILARTADLAKAADAAKKDVSFVLEKIRRESPRPLAAIIAIGEFYLRHGRYQDAEKTFGLAHSMDEKNIAALSGLAKAYHKLNRTKDALPLLEKAEGLSPQNIERLCMLGEMGLSMKDPDKARVYFKKALSIDDEDKTAKAGMVLSDNFSEHLKDTSAAGQLSDQLASVLNTVGITFVRNQQYKKGVDQYLAAMNFVTEGLERAKLEFNLGLAYLRQKDYGKAEEWLTVASKRASGAFPKAEEYLAQVRKLNKANASA